MPWFGQLAFNLENVKIQKPYVLLHSTYLYLLHNFFLFLVSLMVVCTQKKIMMYQPYIFSLP